MYQYFVVPFQGQLKSGQDVGDVSMHLQSLINHYSDQGWEFYRLDAVNITVSPGCLAALMGSGTSFVRYDQVIFRRPRGDSRKPAADQQPSPSGGINSVQ